MPAATSSPSPSASATSPIPPPPSANSFAFSAPAGDYCILEFSLPTNPIFRALYNFYFKRILPRTATWISGDKTGAYKYLPQSVRTFIDRQTMVQMLAEAGFQNVTQKPLTFGICVCYRGFRT